MRLALTANSCSFADGFYPVGLPWRPSVTSRILTRWLGQGVRFGICPLCRAHHKLDREYVWGFSDQWSMQDTAVERFADARAPSCPGAGRECA